VCVCYYLGEGRGGEQSLKFGLENGIGHACTQQMPFLQGAWSTCSQASPGGELVGGKALMESKELSRALEPHSS
jgi:hypothetical protein